MTRCVFMVLTAMLAAASCAPETKDIEPTSGSVEQAAQSENAGYVYADPASRWRLVVPKGTQVRSTRFDPTTPAHKVKERFEVTGEGRLLVRVDIWDNPEALDASHWIDVNASYLRESGARLQDRTVGKKEARGIVVEQPASCQSASLLTAFFPVDQRMVAVTCANAEDPGARHAFDTVLDSLAMEEGR